MGKGRLVAKRAGWAFWLILTGFLWLGGTASASFVEPYNVAYLNMRSGMPSNNVADICMDSDGFVWIATYGGGLVKYDGYNYFSPNTSNIGFSPRSNSCRSIAEDKNHRLWVAYDEGTDIIDLGTMHKWATDGDPTLAKILAQPSVRVYRDSRDAIWLVTRTYLYYIVLDERGCSQHVLAYKYTSNTPSISIKDMERNGSVWAAIDGGLFRISPRNGKLVKETISSAFAGIDAHYISDFLRRGDEVWIATDRGVYRYDSQSKEMKHYRHGREGNLSHDFATCMALTPDNKLIIGSLGGVNLYNDKTDSFNTWSTGSKDRPLSSDFVSRITVLHNQMWIGTETGGIIKLTPRELQLMNYVYTGENGSLSANPVNAMYVEEDGTLWVGTVEGGLNRKPGNGRQFSHYTTANSDLAHNSVSTLAADNRRQLWIGTWGGGLALLDMNHPEKIFPLQTDERFQRLLVHIGALQYDPLNDLMWIGSNDGLYCYNYHTRQIEEPFDGCQNIRGCIGSIIDKDGKLWVGCLEGVRIIDLKSRKKGSREFACRSLRYKLDNPQSETIEKISCFCQTHDGNLWLGSNEYGLYLRTVDAQGNEHFQNFTMQHGLANNAVKGIVEDSNGLLWVTTINGLSQLNPRTGVINNYNEEDGLASAQFYWNSAIIGSDGRIYLGSDKGLTELHGIDPNSLYAGHLRFTHLTVDNKDIYADGKHIDKDISQAKRLQLHESDKTLTIEFSALNYGNERNGVYCYRMKGIENEWIQLPPGQHSLRYTSLPAGEYTLEVRYASALQNKDSMISLNVVIAPYFWKSWWFVSAFFIALAVAAAYAYRKRIESIRETMRKQETDKAMEPIKKALIESKDPKQLQSRIESILHMQRKYEESYSKSAEEDKAKTERAQKTFMDKVIGILEKNYMNSEFGVAELCEAMNMSRSLLSKRLNEEAGLPTTQFIRNYRLNIAKQLLSESGGRNIAEIAFSVGFNDPKYFTRCFTKYYGKSPSAIN